MTIRLVAFDADDTLWHCENLFQDTQQRLVEILDNYAPHDEVVHRLETTERQNVKVFGYGIKGFTLSMIESAIAISDGKITASDIHEIIGLGKAMLQAPLELFDGIDGVLVEVGKTYRIAMITKGDLLNQRSKIDESGLEHRFELCEVVAEKDPATYQKVFDKLGVAPAEVLMVGNSMKSDILPVLKLGGAAIHIPYHTTALIEKTDETAENDRLHQLSDIRELPDFLSALPQ